MSGHNSCWGTNVSGHKRAWSQSCLCANQMCLGTSVSAHKSNVSGHKRVWAQSCMGLIVWAQICLGTNMSGHKCVWAQTCVGTVVWTQSCMAHYGYKRGGTSSSLSPWSKGTSAYCCEWYSTMSLIISM